MSVLVGLANIILRLVVAAVSLALVLLPAVGAYLLCGGLSPETLMASMSSLALPLFALFGLQIFLLLKWFSWLVQLISS